MDKTHCSMMNESEEGFFYPPYVSEHFSSKMVKGKVRFEDWQYSTVLLCKNLGDFNQNFYVRSRNLLKSYRKFLSSDHYPANISDRAWLINRLNEFLVRD